MGEHVSERFIYANRNSCGGVSILRVGLLVAAIAEGCAPHFPTRGWLVGASRGERPQPWEKHQQTPWEKHPATREKHPGIREKQQRDPGETAAARGRNNQGPWEKQHQPGETPTSFNFPLLASSTVLTRAVHQVRRWHALLEVLVLANVGVGPATGAALAV